MSDIEPWRPPTAGEVAGAARMLRAAWGPAFGASEGAIACGALAQRVTDLSLNYGRMITARRDQPTFTWRVFLTCPCGDEQRIQLTDEQYRRGWYEPLLGQVADVTLPVQVHAEACPLALRRPRRPRVRLSDVVSDHRGPLRPTVVRGTEPGLPWVVTFKGARGARRSLGYRAYRDAVRRAHEVARLLAEGHTGEFYSRDQILVGPR